MLTILTNIRDMTAYLCTYVNKQNILNADFLNFTKILKLLRRSIILLGKISIQRV